MAVYKKNLDFKTNGQGTYEITDKISDGLYDSKFSEGIVSVFVCHTSCSLVLMENADPTARVDLEHYLNKLVPEGDPDYTHTYEGPDDMPSHIRMALTRTSEVIPVINGQMTLGTWQGLFLFEHRNQPHSRRIVVMVQGE